MDPERSRGRDHLSDVREHRRRLGPLAFLVLTLGALTAWPPRVFAPTHQIDPSWQLALHLAQHARLAWGREVLFSYGPLAFIEWPNVITYSSLPLGLLYGGLCVALIVLVPVAALREYGMRIAVGTSLAFCVVAPTDLFLPELASLCAVAVALLLLVRPDAWRLDVVAAGLGVLLALQLLIKPSTAGIVGIALVVVILADAPHRPRRALAGALAALGGALAVWLVLGQSLADIPRWLHGVLEISLGYSDAMASDDNQYRFEYVAAPLLTALLAWFIWSSAAFPRRRDCWIFVGATATVLWFAFKEGFVRHDTHSTIFFFTVALLAAVVPRRPRRLVHVLLVVGAGLVLAGYVARPAGTAPVESARSFLTLVRATVSSAERTSLRREGLVDIRGVNPLRADILADLRGRTVHVDPTETSVVWGYRLDWHPVPVFQRYSAYTAYLDRLNAEMLSGARAPERILRTVEPGFEGRNPLWDSPRYMLELACRYRQGPSDPRWGSFAVGASRCGSEHVLGRRSFSAGEPVRVPAARDGSSLVVARFTFTVPLWERVVAALTRPIRTTTVAAGGQTFRLADPHSSGPLLVHTPRRLGWATRFGGDIAYDTLVPSRGGSVVFSAIPLAP